MKTTRTLACALLAGAAFALPLAASAATPAITSWADANSYYGGPWTIGNQFTANQDVTVSALGVYDPAGGALSSAATVSLWTDSGTLLASAVVDNAGAVLGDFRYESLASGVSLTAGQTYRIGVGVGGSPWLYDAGGIVTDSAITYDWGSWSNGQNVFTNNVNVGSGNNYVSANMLLGVSAVPEATPAAMLAVGLLMIGLVRRKQR